MRLIAADIGGTSSRFTLATGDRAENLVRISTTRYRSGEWSDFNALFQRYLDDQGLLNETIDLLLLALPGVIHDGHTRLTNLSWTLAEDSLRKDFAIRRVVFINDYQAAAWGVPLLGKEDILSLNDVPRQQGQPMVVTGAGTGLGMAYQVPGSDPLKTEGGHIDFAPVDDEQSRLLKYLRTHYPEHVSYERILSGEGIVKLYRFLSGSTDVPMAAEEITAIARIGHDDTASRAVQLFTRILAAYAGNLALVLQPFGGIYLASGIAPKIHQWLKTNEFIEYYSAKGRMTELVARIPVILVLNENLGLGGALERAKMLLAR